VIGRPEVAAPAIPRSGVNQALLAGHVALHAVIPGLMLMWGTTLGEGWLYVTSGAARVILLLFALPIYLIYMILAARRFFPRSWWRALLAFAPLAVTAAEYLASHGGHHLARVWLLFSLPLFVGFAGLLVVGLLVLAVMNLAAAMEAPVARIGAVLIIAALGAAPVVYVAALGYQLNVKYAAAGHDRALVEYVAAIALVFFFHIYPLRSLYREGAL